MKRWWKQEEKPTVESIEERLTSVTDDLERATLDLMVQVKVMRGTQESRSVSSRER